MTLEGREDLPHKLCPYSDITSSFMFSHYMTHFIQLLHHNHPKPIIYISVHSWSCASCRFTHACGMTGIFPAGTMLSHLMKVLWAMPIQLLPCSPKPWLTPVISWSSSEFQLFQTTKQLSFQSGFFTAVMHVFAPPMSPWLDISVVFSTKSYCIVLMWHKLFTQLWRLSYLPPSFGN